ncbi:MAG: hypothetical protein ACRDJN_01275 [Chloroflexota bacterium]
MEHSYRAANGLYFYVAFLIVDALILAYEAITRLRTGQPIPGVLLAALAALCVGVAVLLFARWGRLRIVITPEMLSVFGDGPSRRIDWADVERVREVRGPAYQLSLRDLLPGPYLPLGLLRGETVLELSGQPAMRIVVRRALVSGYGALRQDVLSSIPKDTEVDLHARWWHESEASSDEG